MFNKAKFRASVVIAEKTMREVAEHMGINVATLYRKIARNGDFTREEIIKITKFLKLENAQEIFFEDQLA